MTDTSATSDIPKRDTNQQSSADTDSEAEDVFHDARFPAEEEAVSCKPLTRPTLIHAVCGMLTQVFTIASPKSISDNQIGSK